METIGVTSIEPWFVLDDDSLRNGLIYFDKLFYTIGKREILEKFCRTLPHGKEKYNEKIKEIEALEKAGLITEYSDEQFEKDKLKYGNEYVEKYTNKASELSKNFTTKDKPFEDVFVDFLERFREVGQLNARAYSLILNEKQNQYFTPIIRSSYYDFTSDQTFSSSNVLSVLFKKFPTINDSVELERFIEFKNDSDTKLKLARLRDWVLEISKKNYSEKEIEQKIDYLLQEYSKHLEIHKMKYDWGTIQTFVVTTLEIIENVAKLKFSTAAKVLFDLGKQNINLLEAEQKFTGKELALIHELKTKNRL